MKRTLAVFATLAFAACSTIPRYEAANDIHAFMVAIRDGDRATFDAHVDKPALKTQLHARLMSEAGARHGDLAGMGALLAGPLVDLAVDAAARPEVFRAVAIKYGYDPARPLPGTLAIAQLVRPLDGDRACIVSRPNGPCLFVFKNEGGTWRLIGFEGHIALDRGGQVRLTE